MASGRDLDEVGKDETVSRHICDSHRSPFHGTSPAVTLDHV